VATGFNLLLTALSCGEGRLMAAHSLTWSKVLTTQPRDVAGVRLFEVAGLQIVSRAGHDAARPVASHQ